MARRSCPGVTVPLLPQHYAASPTLPRFPVPSNSILGRSRATGPIRPDPSKFPARPPHRYPRPCALLLDPRSAFLRPVPTANASNRWTRRVCLRAHRHQRRRLAAARSLTHTSSASTPTRQPLGSAVPILSLLSRPARQTRRLVPPTLPHYPRTPSGGYISPTQGLHRRFTPISSPAYRSNTRSIHCVPAPTGQTSVPPRPAVATSVYPLPNSVYGARQRIVDTCLSPLVQLWLYVSMSCGHSPASCGYVCLRP
jgi:hypothetical protein